MKDQFKSIKVQHLTLLGSSMLFLLVALFNNDFKFDFNFDLSKLEFFDYIPPIALIGYVIGMIILEKNLKDNLNPDDDLNTKMGKYRNQILLRSALMAGGAFLAAGMILMTGQTIHVIVFALAWLLLVMVRPRIEEFIRDYKLSSSDEFELRK